MIGFNERLQIINGVVDSKKGLDPVVLDLRGLTSELDAFFICHGTSSRHVKAVTEWSPRNAGADLPFMPTRVVLQDYT